MHLHEVVVVGDELDIVHELHARVPRLLEAEFARHAAALAQGVEQRPHVLRRRHRRHRGKRGQHVQLGVCEAAGRKEGMGVV